LADLLNIDSDVLGAFQAFKRELEHDGFSVKVTSGYRSIEEQKRLAREHALGTQKLPVATPGCSTHNYGFAIDAVIDPLPPDLRARAHKWNLVWAGNTDPVHFDPFGFTLWRAILTNLRRDPQLRGVLVC